jgi:hypothetical protein
VLLDDPARAVEAGTYRADGDVEHFGDVLVGHVVPGEEQQGLAVAGLERLERTGERRGLDAGVDAGMRLGVVVVCVVHHAVALVGTQLAHLAAGTVSQQVGGDPEQHGRASGRVVSKRWRISKARAKVSLVTSSAWSRPTRRAR